MIHGLIGQKLDQTQKFLENGKRIPVTEVAVSDNVVLQIKNLEKDKYTAVQLGYGLKKRAKNALVGHAKKAGLDTVPAVMREISFQDVNVDDLPKPGDSVSVDAVFKAGDVVNVTGTSKGKGFAGVVKRHGFRGGPKTHGQSDRHRAPGSIGQTTTPGRVFKGKRMAGHMGVETVTVTNLKIVAVDPVNKTISVLGLVPGHRKAIIFITKVGEDAQFVPLLAPAKQDSEEVVVASNAIGEEVKEDATSNVADGNIDGAVEEAKDTEVATAEDVVVEPVSEVVVDEEVASDAIDEETKVDATSTSNVADADVADENIEEETPANQDSEEKEEDKEGEAASTESSGEPKKEEKEDGK